MTRWRTGRLLGPCFFNDVALYSFIHGGNHYKLFLMVMVLVIFQPHGCRYSPKNSFFLPDGSETTKSAWMWEQRCFNCLFFSAIKSHCGVTSCAAAWGACFLLWSFWCSQWNVLQARHGKWKLVSAFLHVLHAPWQFLCLAVCQLSNNRSSACLNRKSPTHVFALVSGSPYSLVPCFKSGPFCVWLVQYNCLFATIIALNLQ